MEPIFPPFEPEREPEHRRFRFIPLRVIIPNAITLAALASGLTSVRFAIEGKLEYAAIFVIAAAFLDGLDGRIARLLKGTSRFGAELDSLADFVSFGCAPALILYFWKLHNLQIMGWVICLFIAFAMALRLARFNVSIDAQERPAWQKAFAVGVPAPAGAMLVMLPLHLHIIGLPSFSGDSLLIWCWTLFSTLLIVSRIPTFSGKGAAAPVRREYVVPLFAAFIALLSLLISHPIETVTGLTIVYLALIPLSIQRYLRRQKQEQQNHVIVGGENAENRPEEKIAKEDEK